MAQANYDLVIRGGTVATAADTVACDVGIRDGRVIALAEGLGPGADEIDATGKLVLPGGVDSHCHIDQPSSMGATTADDFRSGSISAACGGTTCIIPFAAQHRGQSLRAVVEDYHARARGKAVIDYAFHLIVSDPTEQVLGQELPALIKDGYTSFKIYMTYDALKLDDRQILDVLAAARREGAMVMVHAENHDVIAWLTERLIGAGRSAPQFHAVAHAAQAEREATHRAITLAEIVDLPILIVHVSARAAMEEIRAAKARGLRLYAETCPQYLFLTAADLDREGFEGAKYVCSPPPRDAANQEFVWRGLEGGVFDVFSSDHAPYRYDDPEGKQMHGKGAPFNRIANGVPGLEIRMPMLFSAGVGTGRIGLNRFVDLCCTRPAKLYGLYPRKGSIAVGGDADIAIWNPELKVTISQDMLHDNLDYTPYEGRVVTGWPVTTLSRGTVVWDKGAVLGEPGRGQFLRCDLPAAAHPLGRRGPRLRAGERRLRRPMVGRGQGMSRIVTVAAAQLGPIARDEPRPSVVQRMIRLMREAAARGADLVVYPELALTTFFPRWLLDDAEVDAFFEAEMPGPETRSLFEEAASLGIAFHLGYAELAREGGKPRRFNTAILVDNAGAIVGKYRKVHLPGHAEHEPEREFQHLEKRYFEVGNLGFPVWEALGGRVGMLICNDRRWPEAFRVLGLQGVELVLIGYNTPALNGLAFEPPHRRAFHNHLTMQAGAYQNGTWVVAASPRPAGRKASTCWAAAPSSRRTARSWRRPARSMTR